MESKRTLYVISGATGMTGSELVHRLLESGSAVIGFDNFFASSIDTVKDYIGSPNFTFHEWDLDNEKDMESLRYEVENIRSEFDRVIYINCAAVVHTEHFYEVEHTFKTNVISMKTFLQQAIDVGADTFINCSTSEVYSMQSWNSTGGVREDDFLVLATAEHSQRTSYAVGKLLTEFFMKDAVDKSFIKGCSIRFANVYSKHERFAKHIIPHIINQLLDGKKVELLENSKKNKRTFLHNEDSCSAVISLMASPEALDGSVYNVATDEEVSIVDLVHMIADKMGVRNPEIVFTGHRESDPERRLLNTDKIRERTNWCPRMSLEKGLELCVKSIDKV